LENIANGGGGEKKTVEVYTEKGGKGGKVFLERRGNRVVFCRGASKLTRSTCAHAGRWQRGGGRRTLRALKRKLERRGGAFFFRGESRKEGEEIETRSKKSRGHASHLAGV